jgi:cysteinyl-tRNA synthetase
MSTALLGDSFDIHAGGMDLKFPHHENEIAQSCGATGHPFAKLWMHNGFVNVDDEKMSKSLGNFFTYREVKPRLRHPEVLRYLLLGSHYRGPINYSMAQLEQSDAALGRLYNALRGLPVVAAEGEDEHAAAFARAMDDDFNTPEAIAVLQTLAREINTLRAAGNEAAAARLAARFRCLAVPLGLVQQDPESWFRLQQAGEGGGDAGPSDEEIEAMIAARLAAKKAKDFAESDRLRDTLAAQGVLLEDKPGGVTAWRRR